MQSKSVHDTIAKLREYGIRPTPQRVVVAEYVLATTQHPSADEVWEAVRKGCPTISRATVYNTLNLLVDKGLLRTQLLREGTVVFDPNVARHHHFTDLKTGRIYDVPWGALKVSGEKALAEFEVQDYQVVMRGRAKKARGSKRSK